ncbi:hypothetical protein IM816_11610 [Luteibacter flocculans]|uniref:Uncharacterized protein n=1 Tax=Luteibacter flocculans TaxID=2780091 RepID=A0ABY4T1Y3_9GAMM|nr:hypothetical protein [Luteibacter flocculans]URL57285.1 hypothetical protein IM816_11610 [Luteibacter flocculans]
MATPLKWLLLLASLTLTTWDAASHAMPSPQSKDYSGQAVAENLQRRFRDKSYYCGVAANGHKRPAFLCSGILMRSTHYSPEYDSWLPNPATAPPGVSFSWLRQDSNFPENFPSGNGFVVYPWLAYPKGKGYVQLMVRCIYPRDAWTDKPDRCQTHQTICQDQGIYSDGQWVKKGFKDDKNQCAFGVEDSRQRDTAEAWMQVVDVRRDLNIFARNEVIIAAWPQDVGEKMPVEAFFYRTNCFYTDDDCGAKLPVAEQMSPKKAETYRRAAAMNDQSRFLTKTGRWVPVILWTPATESTKPAKFTYRKEDQAVPEPPDTPEP